MKRPDKKHLEMLNNILLFDKPSLKDKEKQLIIKAFDRAWDSYQQSPSSEKFEHYLDVALLVLKEIGLGATSVISSLMHGITISQNTFDEIEEEYGHDVRVILEGFNRISSIQTDRISYHSETFRNMFLTMVDDIRVLLVKLAHRLYDLRHLDDSTEERQKKVINEVKHVFIPVSHRLGLYNI